MFTLTLLCPCPHLLVTPQVRSSAAYLSRALVTEALLMSGGVGRLARAPSLDGKGVATSRGTFKDSDATAIAEDRNQGAASLPRLPKSIRRAVRAQRKLMKAGLGAAKKVLTSMGNAAGVGGVPPASHESATDAIPMQAIPGLGPMLS